MKVYQLIEALLLQPQDLDVVVRGYESGYNDANFVVERSLLANVGDAWYEGDHVDVTEWSVTQYPNAECKRAVHISASPAHRATD
jgi:hypothetical protein